MASSPTHEIADLTRVPGELSFEVRIGQEARRLWIRTVTPVTPPADAALAACLMPAMRCGGTLSTTDPVSPRLLRTQREFQAIQRYWSLDWDFGHEPLREVEVQAPTRTPEERPKGRVAAFFSGGVDSWSTVLTNPDITDLIFVRGLDLVPGAAHQVDLADEVEARLGDAAAALGMPLHIVETNIRDLSDQLLRWETYYSCPMVAIALFFEPLFERVLIASDTDHQTQPPLGGSRMVDQLWSTELLEIVDDGGRFTRQRRLELIVDHPIVQQTLRVCWENPDGKYNCGRCRKCMLTMVSLEAMGARERILTFPPELDLRLFADFEILVPVSLVLWEDALETMRTAGRTDLEQAIEPMVVRGRRNLGLPPSYRSRKRTAATDEPQTAAHEAQAQLETIFSSHSWRLTAPLRRLGAALRRPES
jgi:hypothetical protein